jgi:membrane protease subunit (stomatin/prohibitin family)
MKFVKIRNKVVSAIECKLLNNDVLMFKSSKSIDNKTKVHVKKNQYVILIENGKVLAAENRPGYYEVSLDEESDNDLINDWIDYSDEKTIDMPLSLVFINVGEIVDNSFKFNKPFEYIDYTKMVLNEKTNNTEPFRADFVGEGKFNFQIVNPCAFLSSIRGIREHFAKEELLELIRSTVANSVEEGVKELSENYKLSVQVVRTQTSELEIKVSENNFDEKLAHRGIKLTYFEITKFNDVNNNLNEEEKLQEENQKQIEDLFNQLYVASKQPEFIEAKDVRYRVNQKGQVISKIEPNVCKYCGKEIDEEAVYCMTCGIKLK